jgi:hypothetical protein
LGEAGEVAVREKGEYDSLGVSEERRISSCATIFTLCLCSKYCASFGDDLVYENAKDSDKKENEDRSHAEIESGTLTSGLQQKTQ